MRDVIRAWIPIDTNVNAPNYQIPNFENQKDLFVAMLAPSENEPPSPPSNPHSYNEPKDEKDKKIDELTLDWIDTMSYSHNVSSNSKESHLGELTLTKFVCDRSPSLNYMALRREIIPHIIHRCIGKMKDNVLPIIEYELHYCTLRNVSISGGVGGKPVETLSIACKIMIIKNIKINVESGELLCYQVCNWDTLKETGSKTIRPSINGTSTKSSLLDLAKKRLMVDFDSHDPSMIKLLKDLGIVSEYNLPHSDNSNVDETEFHRVMINKEPPLFQVLDLPPTRTLTVEKVKKSISDKLNIPLDTIKHLFNHSNGILIDSPKILKISTSYMVQLTDGKFYGH
ncbi:hypothetical protein DDB_G0288943 [Dictyostelium discoideum AX4]|uniref:Uncharacterized protein n=1 Tax=Dictyostelium discoideum TaxID=44689 RepID=Q54I75_DICDI|nr:hypothetical protein DDB_G0288943 [Dictyostelium discoideum AX4]EAL62995.1 hypothetical protein DDB_G0288943 [Dictyostelium discoideum AX4]|eukprot:XP_636504.1 hypothetical protein DDB_G0288943 [Dictyostelium discoideum AX4]